MIYIVGGRSEIGDHVEKALIERGTSYLRIREILSAIDFSASGGLPQPGAVINCAGRFAEEWLAGGDSIEGIARRLFDDNYFEALALTEEVFTVNRLAYILHLGANAAFKHRAGWGSYSASKAALEVHCKCLEIENYDVEVMHFGRTNTKMGRKAHPGEELTLPTPGKVVEGVLDRLKIRGFI